MLFPLSTFLTLPLSSSLPLSLPPSLPPSPSLPPLPLPLPRLIRLSSPNLNYIIGAGAIILYIDIYLFVVPTTDSDTVAVLCNVTSWLTALGYSLCYGTILAKMWRVYYIFDNPNPSKMRVNTNSYSEQYLFQDYK